MEFIEINNENVAKIGDILYNIRIEQNVAQIDVADKMLKGQSQISGMEHNTKIPGLRTLAAYLEAVGGWKLAIIKSNE